jgi:phage terminase large subunit GpA-like protein
MITAAETYRKSFHEGFKPQSLLSIPDFVDGRIYIPKKTGTPEPGPLNLARTPYLKEILECLHPSSPFERVVVMKGTQLALTSAGIFWWSFTVEYFPYPFMMLMPTTNLGKKQSKLKVAPIINSTDFLKARIKPARERDSGNTTLLKEYTNEEGPLYISGANSAADLSSISVKYIMLDEIDRYPADLEGEGDPIKLAENRTDAHDDRKFYIISSPTIKDISSIETAYKNSDQRLYHVPCPLCNARQNLIWDNIIFEKDDKYELASEVTYLCKFCGKQFEEYWKDDMNAAGKWVPQQAHRHAGFLLPSYYSPLGWLSWRKIVEDFLEAKRENSVEKMKSWKNTKDASVWDDSKNPVINDDELIARREDYGDIVPMQAVVLTSFTDVQEDRVEVAVKAWAYGEESWLMDHKVIWGSFEKKSTKKALKEFLLSTWEHESGVPLKISRSLIDSGYMTQEVYEFVRPLQRYKIFASKGSQYPGKPVIDKPSRIKKAKIMLYFIGTDTAKDAIYARLALNKNPYPEEEVYEPLIDGTVSINPGYMHYNMTVDEEYFAQVLAERPEKVKSGRRMKRVYVQIRDRNEGIDLEVGNYAALKLARPNWKKIITRIAKKAAELPEGKRYRLDPDKKLGSAEDAGARGNVPGNNDTPENTPRAKKSRQAGRSLRRRGGFVNNY